MAEASNLQAIFVQNLIDAGCDPKTTAQCMGFVEEKNQTQLLRLLLCHRCSLLEAVHGSQKKIDCLDYLIYQIQKTNLGGLLE